MNKYVNIHSTNNKKVNKKNDDDDEEEDARDKKLIEKEAQEEEESYRRESLRDKASTTTNRNLLLERNEESVPLVNRHFQQQQQQQQEKYEIEQRKIDNTSFIQSSNEMNNQFTSRKPSVSLTLVPRANTSNANANIQVNVRSRAESILEDHRYKVKLLKKQRKHDIQKRFNDLQMNKPGATHNTSNPTTNNNNNHSANMNEREHFSRSLNCHMTFIFDPNGRLSYWMSKFFFFYFLIDYGWL